LSLLGLPVFVTSVKDKADEGQEEKNQQYVSGRVEPMSYIAGTMLSILVGEILKVCEAGSMKAEVSEFLELYADFHFGELNQLERFPVPFVVDYFVGKFNTEIPSNLMFSKMGGTSG
jgi:hypothetical protein